MVSEVTEFLLAKNDFDDVVKKSLQHMLTDQTFADVTLACSDDTQVKAHRVILGASSPFFMNLFLANPHPHPLVYLRGLEPGDLQNILEFIYLGQTKVSSDRLISFLSIAAELKVEGLAQKDNMGEVGRTQDEVELDDTIEYNENDPSNKVDIEDVEDGCTSSDPDYHSNDDPHQEEATTERTSRKYPCDVCGITTSSNTNLKRHKMRKHDFAPQKNALMKQLLKQRQIAPRMTFSCDQCEFTTSTQKYLRQHINIHQETKPHQCKFCDHTTRRSYDLKKHMLKKHAEEYAAM